MVKRGRENPIIPESLLQRIYNEFYTLDGVNKPQRISRVNQVLKGGRELWLDEDGKPNTGHRLEIYKHFCRLKMRRELFNWRRKYGDEYYEVAYLSIKLKNLIQEMKRKGEINV